MTKPTDQSGVSEAEILDPDIRFLLANERTLLAWVRTGLGFIAGGLALTQLGRNAATQIYLGIGAIFLGAIVAISGYVRFRAADRAIRAAQLPLQGYGPLLQVIAVIVFALVAVLIEMLRLL